MDGRLFHDGREKTMQKQATGPILNPLEMGTISKNAIVHKVQSANYSQKFQVLYGENTFKNAQYALEKISRVLVAFEQSAEFSPRFTSKYDAYLQQKVELTAQEKNGLTLFEDESKGNCAACHTSKVSDVGEPPLFTDFSYDNLGVPANPDLAFYQLAKKYNPDGRNYIDLGLANNPYIKNREAQLGKFKVPTLRNIALTPPYMHNGVFETLREAVEFYNTRDTDSKWGKPEVSENMNKDELGDLKLTDQEIDDLVAFLKTLDDGWQTKHTQ